MNIPNQSATLRWVMGFCLLAVCCQEILGQLNQPQDQRILQAFARHLDALPKLEPAEKEQLKSLLEAGPVTAITDVLVKLYPGYAAAIDSSEDDRVADGIRQLSPLIAAEDPFLAADSSFFLARMLMNHQRFEEALPLLERLATDWSRYSAYQGEVHFFLGVAYAGLLQRDEAIRSFREFLEFYPNATERLRVTAWRNVQELQAIEEGQLRDVQRHMEFSRRRLDQQDTGESTQEKQRKIVNMLAKLIQEEEKKEANASSKNSEKQQSPQENPSAPQQSQDSQQGSSDTGGSSSNANGQVIEKAYEDLPASPWSRLRDRSRDPANNAIKEKLPARYRNIVERYFEAANDRQK
jgi:tetratricopeptide (TPR) repeat protein